METNMLKKEDLLEVETEVPIFVYTAPSCPQCKMVKKFLDKAGKHYQEIDGTLEEIRDALKEEGFKSFPVVKQGAIAFAGFRPDQLRKLV